MACQPDRASLAGRRAAVFDAYGTLFDIHAAAARHAHAIALRIRSGSLFELLC